MDLLTSKMYQGGQEGNEQGACVDAQPGCNAQQCKDTGQKDKCRLTCNVCTVQGVLCDGAGNQNHGGEEGNIQGDGLVQDGNMSAGNGTEIEDHECPILVDMCHDQQIKDRCPITCAA